MNSTDGASPMLRLWAKIIDRFIVPLPFILIWVIGDMAGALTNSMVIIIFICGVIVFGVQTYLLATCGQTLGKKVSGIQIIALTTGRDPFVTNVLIRSWFNFILCLIPGYSIIDSCFIFGSDRRCLHDIFAQTKVVTLLKN
ncbi:MAG: putative RDD family membrane protein YckC [Candidatus Omnitrophota bacterium]|jgi:uncharacterized RDD family membrane protein YckC